jgi:rifampin ADP-ribosylating transferase
MTNEPRPFGVHESGALFHGTKADLTLGEVVSPGHDSNLEAGRTAHHVYVTATLDAATWGAELAAGEGRERIYIVRPLGTLEDDPHVQTRNFPVIRRAPIALLSRLRLSGRWWIGRAIHPIR